MAEWTRVVSPTALGVADVLYVHCTNSQHMWIHSGEFWMHEVCLACPGS